MSVTVNDDRSIDVVLPVSGVTYTIDSPKGKHLRAIQAKIKAMPDATDSDALVIVLSQLVRGGFTMAVFDELDYEDIEELGKALKSFRAFSAMGALAV